MDTFSLELRRIEGNEEVEIEGITFSECVFVRIHINDSFDNLISFPDSLLVFSELERSLVDSGRYLIFTCACGVADDGGWDYVEVYHHESTISWRFSRDQEYSFMFHKDSYREEVARCADQIDLLGSGFILEPTSFVYPEDELQCEQDAPSNGGYLSSLNSGFHRRRG